MREEQCRRFSQSLNTPEYKTLVEEFTSLLKNLLDEKTDEQLVKQVNKELLTKAVDLASTTKGRLHWLQSESAKLSVQPL